MITCCADVVSCMRRAACCHVGRRKFSSALFTSALWDLVDKCIKYDHLSNFVVVIGACFTGVLCTCGEINQRRHRKPIKAQ